MSETQSVYQLITKLCSCIIEESEEIVDNVNLNCIKSVAFKTLLLSGNENNIPDREKLLEEVNFVNFELKLAKRVREANEIQEYVENFNENYEGIFWLLLNLRNIDSNTESEKRKHDRKFFKISSNFDQINDRNAYLSPKDNQKLISLQSSQTTPVDELKFFTNILESYAGQKKPKSFHYTPPKSPQTISKSPETSLISHAKIQLNWENLDNECVLEKSFSSESSEAYNHLTALREHKKVKEIKKVTFDKLLNDIRLLTIGIESETFKRANEDVLTFEVAVNVTCDNITSLDSFIDDFLEAGSCFRRLKTFTSKNPFNQSYIFEGFIFKAFCDSLVKFMNSYRDIVYSQKVDTILEFTQNTKNIRAILVHITKFLNIHPTSKFKSKLPTGSDFLNFLHHEYTTIVCESTKCFFVECLKACCQVYFINLQKWLFHATLDDRFKELFIYFIDHYRPNTKYFFDKAYNIQKNSVPSFLLGCADQILLCGKYTMLLRSFNQMHPLFSISKPQIKVCMTDDEISLLTIECKYFVQNARDVCGRKISIEEILNERRQNKADKFHKAEEASFKNFQRWQQEQDDIQKAINERRELQMQDLQDELRRIEERKLVKRMEEIQHEKNYLDDVKNIEIAEMETENEAARKRIEIYEKLNKKLDEEVVMKEKLITNLHKKFTENTMEIQLQSNDVESDEKISEMNGNLQQQQQTMSTDEMNNLVQTTTPLSEAQKNKMKVMSHEYNFSSFSSLNDPNGNASMPEAETPTLTEAQRNKLKIMGHEFEMIEIEKAPKITLEKSDVLTDLQKNRLKVLSSEFYLNENHSEHQSNKKISELNLLHVSPRISQNLESPVNSDIMAMSMTSDHFSNESTEMKETSSSSNDDDKHDKHDMNDDDDDDLFRAFEEAIEKNSSYFMGVELSQITKSYENVKSTDALEMSKLLQKSIMIPVNAYMEILNNETLKMFVENLNIISHFKSLRNYFLMMNGEFSISVCHQLFTKLENNIKPSELLNYQSLHMILDHALSNSRHDENTEQLSFIVKNIPENFEIYSPAVLNMLTLSYKLQWPLNLILNPETMEQYQAIFNYLLKLKRISWVLDECVQLLKTLHKKHGKNLLHSPQFRNVQQIRHKMTHVVHCLENYVTRNVLQISWIGFMEDLKKAESVHCVYKKHTSFLKRILFLCLLNKKSAEFQRQIEDSFKVILRFHKHLKNAEWLMNDDGTFTDPQYSKFLKIDIDFEKIIVYVMYLGNKVIQYGYQKEIYDLLYLIDINEYYENRKIFYSSSSRYSVSENLS